jgi:UDP-N-acetylmuramate dehydrogenase
MEPMKKHTTFRIGGPADLFVIPDSEKCLTRVVDYCRRSGTPFNIVGNGSNLLVSDEGYRGVIIQIGRNLSDITVIGEQIHAQAGALLSTVAHRALDASLTGMEQVSGIPGTLGGALTMNAGAYGGEMKDITQEVTVLTADGKIVTLKAQDLQFGYRTSIIQKENMIVLSAVLKLQSGDRDKIQETMNELRGRRQEKQPLDMPSAGSTFKRPEGYFAGALIDEAGLRGYRVGGAQVSEKHCGFVVNKGGATAADVRKLIDDVKQIVYDDSGVILEPEVRMLGFDGDKT